ncbi:aminoglycoside 3'-phosphotransferase [Clostridium sp. D2Q-11]|uniref:Aminoglycoside 3'-phosphotransferase n=1 Tax=Anaeromonas frigoriresistens TaxID=2683708 RepID=A0A942UQ83_9FIRM|nr:APH(3') family aminoglycoside O-phosphotransferase [Anaeromonas frigoriresistens]MBS4537284.1 aminoglycoside 3'-phosphotransferase [Anaeromonas frigoriresistens]
MHLELPEDIKQALQGFSIKNGPSGLSGTNIYRFEKENKMYFLKVVDVNNRFIDELEVEYEVLKWLEGKFQVPQVITFKKTSNKHFLLMTAIKGNTLEKLYHQSKSSEEIVKIYAESLKLIHGIKISGCPNKEEDEFMLLKAREYLELGINLDNMEDKYKNLTPLELYDKLLSLKPEKNDNVFIHGDYCFDNIIINNNMLNGIIDVGRAGIGDKYKDIALAVRNIQGDIGEQWLDLFFNIYGITNPDWNKIEFYIIMDEFY